VKDSEERITQPGKIAIIYSQEKDAAEYLKYRGSLIIKIPNHGYSPRFGKGLKGVYDNFLHV
jgi:hypothetical protein